MIEEYIKSMLGKIDTSLIAEITKIYPNGFVDVEPLAEFREVKLPPILHVPMCQLGNRNINIKINFKAGDKIPILICSRDISGYITKETTVVNTNKRHNLTNAIALPILIPTDPTAGNLTVNGDVNISGNLTVGDIKAKSLDAESGVSKGGVPYNHP